MGAVTVWAAPPGLVRAEGIGHATDATLAAGGGTAVQCLPLHQVNGTVTPIAGAACASLQGIFVQLWQGIGVAVSNSAISRLSSDQAAEAQLIDIGHTSPLEPAVIRTLPCCVDARLEQGDRGESGAPGTATNGERALRLVFSGCSDVGGFVHAPPPAIAGDARPLHPHSCGNNS